LIVLLLLPLTWWRSARPLSDWTYTHWLFNYQEQFTKRGLPGELLARLNLEPSYALISQISLWLTLLGFVVLTLMFARPLFQQSRTGLWLFLLLAVSHSATLQHLRLDLGRFDIIGLLLGVLALLTIRHRPVLAYLLVPLLMALAIVVHEAMFFIILPLVMGYWIYRTREVRSQLILLLIFLALTGFTYLVATKGTLPQSGQATHLATLQAQYGERVTPSSLVVLYRGDLETHAQRTLANALTTNRLLHHLAMLVLVLPVLLLFFSSLKKQRDRYTTLLLLGAAAPLLLYPLGHDNIRWWALAVTNGFIALSLLARDDTDFGGQLANTLERFKLPVVVLVLLALFAGPMGNTTSFPCSPYHLWVVGSTAC
jgi:hypothetical protein